MVRRHWRCLAIRAELHPHQLGTWPSCCLSCKWPATHGHLPAGAQQGAPKVLVILRDVVDLGATSALGGPYHTPAAERLAAADSMSTV
jgi:hypothetical protein